MKNNIFKHLFLALTLVLGLTSCEDRDIVTIDNVSAPMTMDLSTNSLVLDKNFPANPALTVTWTPAKLTVPVELKYKVEISSTEAFAEPITLITKDKSETFASFTNKEMNEAAKKIGLVAFESQKMYFRVTSLLANDGMSQKSPITSLNITPYLASPTYDYQDLFLIGNGAVGNWDNLATNKTLAPLLKTSNGSQYAFTGLFKSGADVGFKIIKQRGSWEAQFGAGAAAGTLSTDGGSGNLSVPADGYYKLSIDIDALTYTLVPVAAPTKTYTSISIIGTVNGDWNNDTQLTQSTFDPHLWSASAITLGEGEFKFRANNAWDTSWGTNAQYFGTAVEGGANIPLAAEWTYDVYFNDATGNYTLIPIK